MIFRRLIAKALLVGIFSGLILTVVQLLGVLPLISAAESYEIAEQSVMQAWAPEEGRERMLHTLLNNIFSAMGFALIMLGAMNMVQLLRIDQINVYKGLLWGIAGFMVFFLLPGIGLPPEIPGMQAASLQQRQLWWVFTAVCAVTGFALLCYSPKVYKLCALIVLALPFIIGAPHLPGPEFSHPDPAVIISLVQIHEQFITASFVANFIFWLLCGFACAWALNHDAGMSVTNGRHSQ